MKSKLLQILFCALICVNVNAQSNLTVDQSYTVEEMVMDFFNHPEITISNVSFTGDESAVGFFDSGDPDETELDVGAGIVISTGNASSVVGPNNSSGTSTNQGMPGDVDLNTSLSGMSTNDAAVISFDLQTSNTLDLDFSFVFGSEEYCEFTGTGFNDVFGFFVSGPGLSGPFSNNGENIAIIPVTGEYISINNISNEYNTDFFIPNNDSGIDQGCGAVLDPENMQFDGFSVAMDAGFVAEQGETYQVRIAIADVSDAIYDTGIFLAFNSLSMDSLLTPPAQFSASNVITNGAEFTNESKYATSFLWDFGNGTTSTEKNPGLVSYATAGTYEVELTTKNYCCTDVYTQTITVAEVGLSTSVSTSNNPLQCPGDSNASVELSIEGGLPPYTVVWEQGNIDPENLSAGFYQYTITDDSGQELSSQFEILSPDDFSGTVESTPDIDQLGNGSLEIVVAGGTSPYIYEWSTGATTALVENLEADSYTVTVTDINSCTSVFSGEVEQMFVTLAATALTSDNPLDCIYSNAEIVLSIVGGVAPYAITWTPQTNSLSDLSAGTYSITVEDQEGTTTNLEVEITDPALLDLSYETTAAVGGLMNGTATATYFGGTPPYTFLWSDGATTPDRDNLATGDHEVVMTDANQCSESKTITIESVSSTIESSNNSFTFDLFPNPARDFILINCTKIAQIETIQVFDVLGNNISINQNIQGDQITVSWNEQLVTGMYYLRIQLEDGKTGIERFTVH